MSDFLCWPAAILRALDAVEAEITGFESDLTIARLCLGAALGYHDRRRPGGNRDPLSAEL